MGMTTREEAILWLNSFVKNKEPMTLIPKQLIRLMHKALTEQPEVVRCKDCKHFDGLDCKVNDIVNIMDTNWYCADGEFPEGAYSRMKRERTEKE